MCCSQEYDKWTTKQYKNKLLQWSDKRKTMYHHGT